VVVACAYCCIRARRRKARQGAEDKSMLDGVLGLDKDPAVMPRSMRGRGSAGGSGSQLLPLVGPGGSERKKLPEVAEEGDTAAGALRQCVPYRLLDAACCS
jgi:hypothetical protein